MLKNRAVTLGLLVFMLLPMGQFFGRSLLANNHEAKFEKAKQQIQMQYENKMRRLESWTQKRMDKCNGHASCQKKTKRGYHKRKAIIERQYDRRKKALQRRIEKEESKNEESQNKENENQVEEKTDAGAGQDE